MKLIITRAPPNFTDHNGIKKRFPANISFVVIIMTMLFCCSSLEWLVTWHLRFRWLAQTPQWVPWAKMLYCYTLFFNSTTKTWSSSDLKNISR